MKRKVGVTAIGEDDEDEDEDGNDNKDRVKKTASGTLVIENVVMATPSP